MSADQPAESTGTRRGLAGRVLGGRYRVVRMVSAGANTLIADAEDTELSRQVTVKLVRPELAESGDFRERFAADMRKVSTISHPNIAAVFDWGEEHIGNRTTVYAVVEHLVGGSLRDLFDRGRFLDPSQALMVGLEACRAVDFAHRSGLVHGELTPSKLVFGDDRRLRVVDFGLARLLGEHQWAEPATVATHVARYASPEQAQGRPIDGRSDVYSLALILVEAVTGTVPFAARSTVATLSARVGKLMPVSADLGPLASVLERAGRPEPADRSSAAEFGRGLVKAAENLPRPAPIPILAAGLFVEDPDRLRRPNDPTGGLIRPEPEAGVTAVPFIIVPASEPPAPEPEPVAAPAVAAAVAPAPEVADPDVTAPLLYDGDADRTVDELAELARPAEVVPSVAPPVVPPAVVPPTIAEPPAAGPARRRRRWPFVVGGIVLLALLAGLGYLASTLFREETHPVPDLTGQDESVIAAETAGFDWEIDIQNERSDEFPEPGTIIRTAPAFGDELEEGGPFLVVVSEGPELRPLPDVVGRPLADAETTLAQERLRALPATQQFDETVPAGSVIAWSVPTDPALVAGDEVLPDTEVALVVSSGPAPRTIPTLAGLAVADAAAQLEAIQLAPQVAEAVFSDTVPNGSVVSAAPDAGAQVERGSTVVLTPSKGVDLVTMPDLTGQTLDQARTTLANAGLTVGGLLGTTGGIFQSASVGGDPADPGEQYRRGTPVDMVFL